MGQGRRFGRIDGGRKLKGIREVFDFFLILERVRGYLI
jgi:hypothetical protein